MLNVDTLKVVREIALGAQDLEVFKERLDALIVQTEETNLATFKEGLRNVREAFDHALTHCLGCTVLVRQGPRSYGTPAPLKGGVCSRCGKPRG